MKEVNYTVLTNEQIAPDTWKMTLSGDTSAITRPGQFVNFHIQGLYLRRPISVCRREENTLTIVYKVVGKGHRGPFQNDRRGSAERPVRPGERL